MVGFGFRRGFVSLALAALSCFGCQGAMAASVFWLADLEVAALDGAVRPGDLRQIEDLAQAHPELRGLYLNSPGGDFIEAMDIGDWIHERTLTTYASTLCMSACAYIWLGGQDHFANGLVYFHLPFYRTSTVTVAIPVEGAALAGWYLAQIGCDRNLLEALLAVGSTEDNPMFPITGPNTALLKVTYSHFGEEKRFKDALEAARAASKLSSLP